MTLYACSAIAGTSAASHIFDVDTLRTEMARLRTSGVRHFVLDLSQDEYTDDPMLRLLVRALKVTRESRANVVIVARGRTKRLFEITGLTQVFSVHDQLADAVAFLNIRKGRK